MSTRTEDYLARLEEGCNRVTDVLNAMSDDCGKHTSWDDSMRAIDINAASRMVHLMSCLIAEARKK